MALAEILIPGFIMVGGILGPSSDDVTEGPAKMYAKTAAVAYQEPPPIEDNTVNLEARQMIILLGMTTAGVVTGKSLLRK